MSEAEVRAAVEAEGLTLVPSTSSTGFKGVYANAKKFAAQVSSGGKLHNLGSFDTAPEAALHVSRFLGPEGSAAAAQPAKPAQPAQPGMSEAEVRAAVEAEGLTLVPSTSSTGFKGVYASAKTFAAQVSSGGKLHNLGSFDTAPEAALHVSRFLGPEGSAAAAQPGMSEAEVRAAVEAEGLTLVPSTSSTGFKGVSADGNKFGASIYFNGKLSWLGMFGTALEAALHYARFLGPEGSAAAAHPTPSRKRRRDAPTSAAAPSMPRQLNQAQVQLASSAPTAVVISGPSGITHKLALVKEQLGIDAATPLARAVREANAALELPNEGSLVRQVDVLARILELRW